jgi:serine/threonine protein kinase
MSGIYLAQQERPRRQVAVKLLRAASAPSPDAWALTLARFRREADAAAALDHANIVPIYEFGVEQTGEGEIAYLVMPYLADGSLATLLWREGPLLVPQAILYLEQAAAALDYAHQAGIVHRDVKLSNLLLHPDGRLLLADFGVARALNGPPEASLTVSGMTMGTPEYMAPEQIRGERVGPTTDVYALGVVAYTLLAGHTPFETPALAQVGRPDPRDEQHEMRGILQRQLNEPPPPLRTQRAGVSPRLEEAIFWALAKEPSDRPPSAGAFVRAARDGSRSRALSAFFSMASGKADALFTSSFATSLPRFQPSTSAPRTPLRSPARSVEGFMDADRSSAIIPGPDAPTVHELPLLAGRPAPEWPSPNRGPEQNRLFSLTKVLLITVGVLALCALLTGGLSAIGYLLQSGNNPSLLGPVASATARSTMTPQPTATTIPSVTLTAAPASVTLSCGSGKRRQMVTLTNTGQESADWSASLQGAQIYVTPSEGSLDPGEQQNVTLTTGFSLSSQDRQGILRFTSDSGQTEASATVAYTLQSCIRGNSDGALSMQTNLMRQSNENSGKHGRKGKED